MRSHRAGHYQPIEETLAMLALGGGGGSGSGLAFALVLRPGGSADRNVFTSWPALYAASQMILGPINIMVDSSIAPATVPAGAYSFPDGVTFSGRDLASTLTFENGATLVTPLLTIDPLAVLSSSAAPIYQFPDNNSYVSIVNDSEVASNPGAAPFFHVTAAGAGGLLVAALSDLGNNLNPAVTVDGGATIDITVTGQSSILGSSLTGAGTVNVGRSSDSFVGAQPGLVTLDILDNSQAATTTYSASVPGDWAGVAPTNANDAINRIANAVHALLGAPIP